MYSFNVLNELIFSPVLTSIPSPLNPLISHRHPSLSTALFYAPWRQEVAVGFLSAAAVWQPSLVAQPASCPSGALPPV